MGEFLNLSILDELFTNFKARIFAAIVFIPKEMPQLNIIVSHSIIKKKPRIEPNPSFDLCRLACSLFDYFMEEEEDEDTYGSDPIKAIITEWCTDDKGRNILYKKCGEERYPDFKLYKMISRTVHKPYTPTSS